MLIIQSDEILLCSKTFKKHAQVARALSKAVKSQNLEFRRA